MQTPSTEPVLRIDGLCKRYGSLSVLRDLQLAVQRGAVHGLVGLNGAGKTTTLECILGLQPQYEGTISVLGGHPRQLHQQRGRVVAIFDQPGLNPGLTVDQTLQHGALLCGSGHQRLPEVKALLGIERFASFRIRQLSLGNKRRTAIAEGLIGNPELVLLDEPFNGLDAGGVDDVLQLIARLNRQTGTSFLLSSHQLSYLEQICSHLAILHQGRIVLNGSKTELLQSRQTSGHRLRIRLADRRQQGQLEALVAATADLRRHQSAADSQYVTLDSDGLDAAAVNRLLVSSGIAVSELLPQRVSLDSLFRQVTSGEQP